MGIVTWSSFIAPFFIFFESGRGAVNLYLARTAVRHLQLKAARKPLVSNK